jgi:effector-binding domain-containing protein
MAYDVHVEEVVPRPLAVIHATAGMGELPVLIPALLGEVREHLQAHGVRGGQSVAVYLDSVMNIAVGVEVDGPVPESDRVSNAETPGGGVATTVHMGPYHKLGEAFQAVGQWCAENGYQLVDPGWEVYGDWSDDPAQLRTDVYLLLRA